MKKWFKGTITNCQHKSQTTTSGGGSSEVSTSRNFITGNISVSGGGGGVPLRLHILIGANLSLMARSL